MDRIGGNSSNAFGINGQQSVGTGKENGDLASHSEVSSEEKVFHSAEVGEAGSSLQSRSLSVCDVVKGKLDSSSEGEALQQGSIDTDDGVMSRIQEYLDDLCVRERREDSISTSTLSDSCGFNDRKYEPPLTLDELQDKLETALLAHEESCSEAEEQSNKKECEDALATFISPNEISERGFLTGLKGLDCWLKEHNERLVSAGILPDSFRLLDIDNDQKVIDVPLQQYMGFLMESDILPHLPACVECLSQVLANENNVSGIAFGFLDIRVRENDPEASVVIGLTKCARILPDFSHPLRDGSSDISYFLEAFSEYLQDQGVAAADGPDSLLNIFAKAVKGGQGESGSPQPLTVCEG